MSSEFYGDGAERTEDEEFEESKMVSGLGLYKGEVRIVSTEEPAEEIMLLWGIQQPIYSKNNAFVRQSSLQLNIDACGRTISILQSPSSLHALGIGTNISIAIPCKVIHHIPASGTPGVTGSVMWDSGVILGKFLEHAAESGTVDLQGKKIVELGTGCGFVGCIAALLGAHVVLTDLPDRLKLLKKNVEANLYGDVRGSAIVDELTWGTNLDPDLLDPLPECVIGSDVIYSEGAIMDLLATLSDLCGPQTTVILAGELRNDAILEHFLEAARKKFIVGCIDQKQWHPDYCSQRVVIYVLVKRKPDSR